MSESLTPTPDELKSLLRQGVMAVQMREWEEAYELLGEALDGYRKRGEKIPALVLSYYALALGIHTRKFKQALEFCQSAVAAEPARVEHYANLAQLYMAAGIRRKAVEAVDKGLALDGTDRRLLQIKATLGWRRPPVISSLSRDHWLNVFLGKIRHTLAPPKLEVAAVERAGKRQGAAAARGRREGHSGTR
ncbi:MAG: tetratricopeptide repeat protein [Thermoanaerobaculum sp.]